VGGSGGEAQAEHEVARSRRWGQATGLDPFRVRRCDIANHWHVGTVGNNPSDIEAAFAGRKSAVRWEPGFYETEAAANAWVDEQLSNAEDDYEGGDLRHPVAALCMDPDCTDGPEDDDFEAQFLAAKAELADGLVAVHNELEQLFAALEAMGFEEVEIVDDEGEPLPVGSVRTFERKD